MGYLEDNKRKIDSRFDALAFSVEAAVNASLVEIMRESIELLLDIHEMLGYPLHQETKHGLGWVILYNGQKVDYEAYEGREALPDSAGGKILSVIEDSVSWYDAEKGGYQCFLISDMSIPGLSWEAEEEMLSQDAENIAREVIPMVSVNFKRIFK